MPPKRFFFFIFFARSYRAFPTFVFLLEGGRRGRFCSGAAAPPDRALGRRGGFEPRRLQDGPLESRDPRQESGADAEMLAAARGGREAHRGPPQRGMYDRVPSVLPPSCLPVLSPPRDSFVLGWGSIGFFLTHLAAFAGLQEVMDAWVFKFSLDFSIFRQKKKPPTPIGMARPELAQAARSLWLAKGSATGAC